MLLIGGRSGSGVSAQVSELVPWVPESLTADQANNVYAYTRADGINPIAALARDLVYVPNSKSNTLDVIDPTTFEVVDHVAVGRLPQHVTPSWDMKTLYVDNNAGNSLTPIDPLTGMVSGSPITVSDPYNLYFTPDGAYAIVVAERERRLDFRNPQTMELTNSVDVKCKGVDHLDFTGDGSELIASCEFSAQMVVVDLATRSLIKTIDLPRSDAMPQDVKLSPDGSTFYVADMKSNGLWVVDSSTMDVVDFLATDRGAHGLYPSRDATKLYVSNRDTREPSQSWTSARVESSTLGRSREDLPTWGASRPTAACYGCPGATTRRYTPSPPTTDTCSPVSR